MVAFSHLRLFPSVACVKLTEKASQRTIATLLCRGRKTDNQLRLRQKWRSCYSVGHILLEDNSWLAKPTAVPHFLFPHSADNLPVLEEVKQHEGENAQYCPHLILCLCQRKIQYLLKRFLTFHFIVKINLPLVHRRLKGCLVIGRRLPCSPHSPPPLGQSRTCVSGLGEMLKGRKRKLLF